MGGARSASEVLGSIVRRYQPPPRRAGRVEIGKLAGYYGEQDSLRSLAFTPRALPEGVELWSNRDFRAVYEFKAVSEYHVIVLPRRVLLRGPADLRSENLDMLRNMLSAAKQLVSVLTERNPAAASFRAGFHRLPVQNMLHLHLLSMDVKYARKKREYNSFTSRFLIDLEEAIEDVEQHGRIQQKEAAALNYMAQMPRCPLCGYTTRLDNVKKHLPKCVKGSQGQRQLLRLARDADSELETNTRKASAKAARV